jgi:hypothetical protein
MGLVAWQASSEVEHVGSAISDVDDHRLRSKARPRVGPGAFTHPFLVRCAVVSGCVRVSPGGVGMRDIRLLHSAVQGLTRFG